MNADPKVIELIYAAIDEVNQRFPSEGKLAKSPDTPLFGREARLDSLGLVALVVAIEQSLEDTFSVTLTLANEKAFSMKTSPFRTVGTLAEYITTLLQETPHD